MKLDRRMSLFVTLVGVFITCLLVGNLIGGKLTYVHLFGRDWIISVGEIPFPLTFIITDLLNEFYGRKTARKVTLLGFAMIGLTVLVLVLARGFRNERRLTRAHGALLVACFVAYNVYLFTQHAG